MEFDMGQQGASGKGGEKLTGDEERTAECCNSGKKRHFSRDCWGPSGEECGKENKECGNT